MKIKSKKIFLADGSCYENCDLHISLNNLEDFASINDGKQSYLVNIGYIEVFDIQDSIIEESDVSDLKGETITDRLKNFFTKK